MEGTFLALETARRALFAQRLAMDTTGHNVANAATEGYSRQRVDLRASAGFPSAGPGAGPAVGPGQVGTGVDVAALTRARDAFLDAQVRNERRRWAGWDVRQQVLSELEAIFAEPSEAGLRVALDAFWDSWQSLAASPESLAARREVLQRAGGLLDAMKHADQQLRDLADNLDDQVAERVAELNDLAREVASLNAQIQRARARGLQPNDLLDRRDLALDRMAQLVALQVQEGPDGTVRVTVGGVAIVEGREARE
ncbi:MAG: flagellar hook-associated protein FlgK, partial [Clostridia bacterium]|nr:flagellar hook-associated protein FlgK [Clostridia bacterium]